jgi:hypothetical protein
LGGGGRGEPLGHHRGHRSDPRDLGFQTHNTFAYEEEMYVMFCREMKVSEAHVQRLRRTDDSEACATGRAEVRARRWRTDR